MKTLYGILGVASDATMEQIEQAHASFLAKLQSGSTGLSSEEVNNQLVAIREAHSTLTNPILRQRYDHKLSIANSSALETITVEPAYESSGGVFGTKTILLFGVIFLAGLFIYNNNAKERERLRIEHEHEVQMKAIEIAKERQLQEAKVQDVILDHASTISENREAQLRQQQLQQQQQQFERESARQQQLEYQRQRAEQQQEQQKQQQAQNQERIEQQRRQQQLQSEKRLLQQMERDHYGKVITQ